VPGKRAQFDDATLEAVEALASRTGKKKHKQPVGFKAALDRASARSGSR
jgi:hypothetical protein